MPEQQRKADLAILVYRQGHPGINESFMAVWVPPCGQGITDRNITSLRGHGQTLSEALANLAEALEELEDEGYFLTGDIVDDPLVGLDI